MTFIFSRVLTGALLVLGLMVASASAWPYPPANGISVQTNTFSTMPNTCSNVQAALNWLDDNMITSAGGYVTESWLNTYYGSTSTNTFGELYTVNGPTSAVARANAFYGCVVSLTNGGSMWVTNLTLYGKITACTNVVYSPQGWYSTSTAQFTPLIQGYYRVGAEVVGTTTCLLQIVSYDSNQIVKIGTTLGTNQAVNGSGIVYANGTSTNTFWLEGLCLGGAPSSELVRVKFSADYLGR